MYGKSQKNQEIRIRIVSSSTAKQAVYGLRKKDVRLNPRAKFGALYELQIEVVDLGDEPLREIRTFVSSRKGESWEMEQLWATAYTKAIKSGSLFTTGIVFEC